MNNKSNKSEDYSKWILVIVILFVIIIAYLKGFFKERKVKELEILNLKIEENKKLYDALENKKRKYFLKIRCFFMSIYIIINIISYFLLCSCNYMQCISYILNCNTIFFILVSAITFARFGSFKSYHKWWKQIEISIEAKIYQNSPDLKKILSEDLQYKTQLEEEIKLLDL